MRSLLLTFLLLTALFAQSQNVGIGVASPLSKLHVAGTDAGSGNLTITAENPSTSASSGLNLINGTATADFSRYGGTAAGTVFGVSTAHLARLFNSGPILIGASGSSKLYFGTNDQVRMRFDENGLGSINAAISPTAQLNIATTIRDAVYVVNNTTGAGLAFGINSRIYSTVGAAVVGSANVNGEGFSPFENGGYGIIGLAGNTGIGGGFFALKGTALRASSDSGLALSTSGKLQLKGVGEAAGKVLTSDAAGNATWQSLPASPYKAAFIHTATAGNTSGNITTLTYANPAANDILLVTPNLNPNGGGVYNNSPLGVYWTGSAWTIFNQNSSSIAAGEAFNVLVIKQRWDYRSGIHKYDGLKMDAGC